ncbi:MAG: mandelate racemase/muconate lactonizing enzyme family protein [Microvirga sp.]
MRIERANIYLVTAGKLHPVIVELVTDEGVTGIGEAAIAYGIGGTAAAGMVKDLAERMIVGRDPSRIEALWSEMYDHSFWAKGGGAIVFAGISAIETALWDIKGKALGAPLYELLGGRIRDKVRVYANGWYGAARTPGELAAAAERPLRDGYDALKCYPLAEWDGGGLRHVTHRQVDRAFANLAFDKVKALREAVGPKVEIMLDLSGGLTTDETIRLCRRFEELDITWIEEPADPFDIGALKKIAEHVAIPVAVGERIYTRHGFRKILEPHAADIVQPDVGNTGGIMEVKKIAAMAEAYNMRVAPHNCASALSTAASLQIAACIPNFMTQEIYPYFPERPGYVQVLEDSPEERIRDGFVDLPSAPGLGVTLASKRLEPFLWAQITSA